MDTYSSLISLYQDLGTFEASSTVHWPVGLVFNALLEQAKKDYADDPVISAVQPVEQNRMFIAHTDAGSLRTIVGQLAVPYKSDSGPAVA